MQLVLLGAFDAILVNLMQTTAGETWQELRRDICGSLNIGKNARLMEIMRTTYRHTDVGFLQEAGNQLVEMFQKQFSDDFHVLLPKEYSTARNQNSVILLRSSLFSNPREVAVPADGWDSGDLLAVVARVGGVDVTLASFHGDTNGLLTKPMLTRVAENMPTERLLFGMDANTYEKPSTSVAHVLDFEEHYQNLGFQAHFGKVDPSRYTTFNARTFLQPQLNKAAKSTQLVEKGDRNPKDFILFSSHFLAGETWRDNTGKGEYIEEMVFPTLDFPSDHAVIAVDILMRHDNEEL